MVILAAAKFLEIKLRQHSKTSHPVSAESSALDSGVTRFVTWIEGREFKSQMGQNFSAVIERVHSVWKVIRFSSRM